MDKHSLRLSKEMNNSITNNHQYLNFIKKNQRMLEFQRNKLMYPAAIEISRNNSVFAIKEAKRYGADKLASSTNTPAFHLEIKNNQKQHEIISSQKVYQIVQRKHKEIQEYMNKEKQSMSQIIYNYSKFRSMESQYYKTEKNKKKSEKLPKKQQLVKFPLVNKPSNEIFTIDYDPEGKKMIKINIETQISQMKKKSHSLLNDQTPNKEFRNLSQQKSISKKKQQALYKRKKMESQFGIEIKSINSKIMQNITDYENGLKIRKELYEVVSDSPTKMKEKMKEIRKEGDQLLQKEEHKQTQQKAEGKRNYQNKQREIANLPKFKHKYSSSSLSYRELEDLQNYTESQISNKKQQTQKQKALAKRQNFKKMIVMYEKQITVYDQKINCYRQFLFMLNLAHKKYDNLLLKDCGSLKNEEKYKFYIGHGNNSLLVKSLMKRRFWWIMQQDSKKANFAWTQLKINTFFQYQRKSQTRDVDSKIQTNNQSPKKKKMSKKQIQLKTSLKTNVFKPPLPADKDKIFTTADKKVYQQLQLISLTESADKLTKYAHRLKTSQTSTFTPINQSKINERVHNHLQYNHFIGNKKALFYNLKKYYDLQNKNVFEIIPLTFHIKNGVKDPQYLKFFKQFKRLQGLKFAARKKKQKQQKIKKTKNVWIVKPGQLSNRGNGIVVINQIYELNNIFKKKQKHSDGAQKTYIVQKYIQNPLLYKGRKFDIRHYMIITRLHGIMRAYWYGEGYIRTSSFEFDLDDVGDEMIHLTNDAIQKNSTFYGKHEEGNKLSYTQFQKYLDQKYEQEKINFAQHIYPKMKAIATDAVKATYLQLDSNNMQHNFEVFGLDFMIDQQFNVWLIEVNTNPCLEISSKLLGRIIPNMLQQAFRLSIDVIFPPPAHYPNSQKYLTPDNPLGRLMYELIFDEARDGHGLIELYKDSALIDYGQIMQDEQVYQNQGKQIQLSPDIS